MRVAICVLLASICVSVVGSRIAGSADVRPLPVWQDVTGVEEFRAVAAGETLGQIAARFGIKRELAVAINRLADPNRLHIGQRLWLSNRHIVPATLRDGIVINVGDLRLYWLQDGVVVKSFMVGVGRAAWETPPGLYNIVSRRRDPVWHVPPSIQREMKKQGAPVKKKVPPGPDNPLGKYWLQLSAPGYGIHGTNAPWSVGKYTTHGCIRVRPEDIEFLYLELPTGTSVDVIDEPVKLARLAGDHILLEAHRGVLDHPEPASTFMERLEASGVIDLIDVSAAKRVVQDAWGVAVDVSKKKP